MGRSRWFYHPIFIFIVSILALGSSLFLYIYWYIEVSAGLNQVIRTFNLDAEQMLTAQTWVVILVLCLLVGLILLGMFLIFVYSQKMVQLYRLQRNFINNFTHELKTPVASLSLYLETFQKYALPREDQLKYIGYMISDVKRLSDNITRILNLARLESKGFAGKLARVDPVAAIDRFLEKNRYLFADADIGLDTTLIGHFHCRLNLELFSVLLINLLTNAVNYCTAPRPIIHIHVEAAGDRLYVRFRDNGIGFDNRERKKIFKKFYQIGQSHDMSAKGSGIGLFLAQGIAKVHKGRIVASSPGKGKGAEFSVVLPLAGKSGE